MSRFCSFSRTPLVACLFAAAMAGRLSAQAPAPAEDIRGPKALVEIPVPEAPAYALWSGIGCGALLGGFGAFWWKRRTRKQRAKTPHEVALRSLTELESNRESLVAEAFANRAANTVRQYIAERFGLAAPRRTTEEFLQDIARDGSALICESDDLKAFLKACDLAKFAGSNLNEDQRHLLVEAARGFIRSTSHNAKP